MHGKFMYTMLLIYPHTFADVFFKSGILKHYTGSWPVLSTAFCAEGGSVEHSQRSTQSLTVQSLLQAERDLFQRKRNKSNIYGHVQRNQSKKK